MLLVEAPALEPTQDLSAIDVMIKIIEKTFDSFDNPTGIRDLPQLFETRQEAQRFLGQYLIRMFIDPRFTKNYDDKRDEWTIRDARQGTRFEFEIAETPGHERR